MAIRKGRVYITVSFKEGSEDLKFLKDWSKRENRTDSYSLRDFTRFRRISFLNERRKKENKEMQTNYPLFAEQNRDD